MDSRRARARVSLTDNTFLSTSERTLPRLQHQLMYHPLLAALHEVYRSSSPNPSDPLDVCLGARALLEEHYSEEDSVQPSPEDALDYLLDVAIERFGYSPRDVFGGVFCYPDMTLRHEMAFSIKYADLYDAVSAFFKQGSSSDLISNRILALSPVDQGPLLGVRWEVDFKSSWVAKSVIRKLGEAEDNDSEIHQQIRILRSIP